MLLISNLPPPNRLPILTPPISYFYPMTIHIQFSLIKYNKKVPLSLSQGNVFERDAHSWCLQFLSLLNPQHLDVSLHQNEETKLDQGHT